MGSESKLRGVGGISRAWIVVLCVVVSLQAATVLSQVTDPIDKSALLAFRKTLIDNKNALFNWVNATDPCNDRWTGVFCYDSDQPNVRTTYRHVTELRLMRLELTGSLAPELGNLVGLVNLDVMWNQLTGSIPETLGNLANLRILTLSGNNLTGSIPPELGNLTIMNRIQLDENQLSGPVPPTFGGLVSLAHLHLNNNSFSGSIPRELGQMPSIIHILLDNNNLSGPLPEEIANAAYLTIVQLDNNQFSGGIPSNYTTNLHRLTKLSCRNCSLSGTIPDLSNLTALNVIDLSHNQFTGPIPNLSMGNVTVVDFSYNQLEGDIPSFLATAQTLQFLTLSNNNLAGFIPDFGEKRDYSTHPLNLDFGNNSFSYINLGLVAEATRQAGLVVGTDGQATLVLRLYGNPEICDASNYVTELYDACKSEYTNKFHNKGDLSSRTGAPLLVLYRLKSPGFTIFDYKYQDQFTGYVSAALKLNHSQVQVPSYVWEPGPRLQMLLLILPLPNSEFNETDLLEIRRHFANWNVSNSTFFGPYELLGFEVSGKGKSKLRAGAIAGIVVGVLALVLVALLGVGIVIARKKGKPLTPAQKRRARMLSLRAAQNSLLKITGVTSFTYKQMALATDNFGESKEAGRGGYGTVYRGVLEDGQVVAIKRATLEAIQRNSEFYNEIELLSRCHHRNLVALVGYCNDEDEQMLVYEFMERGTLHENLHSEVEPGLDFVARLRIALSSAKGILYLHTDANPPIFHRDIKSNNILLDDKRVAKVADFGLSRLAPDLDELGLETTSHVSTVVKGTPGYLDPEYFITRRLTDKSDVYSFGVVLLELATGMQPITYGKNIVREVRPSFEKGEMAKVVDAKMGPYSSDIMETFMKLAFSCVENETDSRPTMKEVTRTLENLLMAAQGKELREMMSLDISKDDSAKKQRAQALDDHASSLGFDPGSSQNPTRNELEFTSSNFTTQQKDFHSPR